jgi:hypothetical protein
MQKQITRKQFRQLIIVQLCVVILAAIAPFAVGPLTSEGTKAILDMVAETPLTTYDIILGLVFLPLALWSAQNIFALYQFKSYAPKHLLYITVLGVIAGFFAYPVDVVVTFGVEDMFYYIFNMMAGATLALVYFSNIANEFKAPVTPVAPATPTTEPTV